MYIKYNEKRTPAILTPRNTFVLALLPQKKIENIKQNAYISNPATPLEMSKLLPLATSPIRDSI